MSFVRAVSWTAENAEWHCSYVRTTLTEEHINVHVLQEVWVRARILSYFNCLKLKGQQTFVFRIPAPRKS